MKVIEVTFEGTTEEYQGFLRLRGQGREEDASVASRLAPDVEFVRKIIHRMAVPNGQSQLFRALYEGGEQGLSRSELALRMGRTEEQLSGILGGFGRRIQHTVGVQSLGRAGRSGVEHVLDVFKIGGQYYYRMLPELRLVIGEVLSQFTETQRGHSTE